MRYFAKDWCSYRDQKEGPEMMANFVCKIVQETRHVFGDATQTVFKIEGHQKDNREGADRDKPVKLKTLDVKAEDFPSMAWVMAGWGSRAVIMPGSSVKEDLRTMIQIESEPEVVTVYRQTGWAKVDGKQVYLHVGGAIGANGNDASVSVALPHEMRHYRIEASKNPRACVQASLELLNLADRTLTWPLLAATLAPLYGPVDFALHVTGRTGSFKSEIASLFQSHYGAGMDARNLPGSWSSTENAIEALCYHAANAVFVVDDFVPHGTQYQQKAYQGKAERIVRAVGNQAGRARLTDVSSLQQTMYPRGLVFSTGEDTPEGHSVRARMMIREIAAGDVESANLTDAQANRPLYQGTTAWLIQSLCKRPADLKERGVKLRTEYQKIGHSRTPGMLARLVAVVEDFAARLVAEKWYAQAAADTLVKGATAAILAAGEQQQSFLEDADPVDMFLNALRQVLASGGGHFRTVRGGTPVHAELLGWSAEREVGGVQTYKARGQLLGWARGNENELCLDLTSGYNIVRKVAGNEMPLSKLTLLKRLKEAGALARVDEGRGRNSIRITAEGHARQVVCFVLTDALELKGTEETEDGEEEDDIPD